MAARVATIDFHVTSECSQECPYCWGPQDYPHPVGTHTALRIISRVKRLNVRRIVFTGGDPLKRADISQLIRHASSIGLEVAVSTTGDQLTPDLLDRLAPFVDLMSLPLDGSCEAVNSRTKEPGQFGAVLRALSWLRDHPRIDVKVCTPVTQHNLDDVPHILRLVERYAASTEARVFFNVFQAYPRALFDVEWDKLLVGDQQFAALKARLHGSPSVRVNLLDHATLDRLYVMIFPDGRLVIPCGPEFTSHGRFLDIENLDAVLRNSRFDWRKHLRHSRAWTLSDPRIAERARDSAG